MDVVIQSSRTIEGKEDGTVVIVGSPAVISSVDAKDPRQKTMLQAKTFTVFPVKDKPNLAERIEADGNFSFDGTRPTPDDKGLRNFKGTGSKGVYYKQEGRMVFHGPVTFAGQQPSADGKATQNVEGTASGATYMEKDGTLTAQNFQADFSAPGFEGKNHFSGDAITINMTKRPYTYKIENNEGSNHPVTLHPSQPEKKPDNKKPEKKPG